MLVIGIDPGLKVTGYGLIKYDSTSERVSYVNSGNIVPRKNNLVDRIEFIYGELKGILEEFSPDVGVVEDIFFAKNVKSAIKLAHLRGVILLSLKEMKIPFFEYTPLEIKQSVAGYGRAEKEQIKKMVCYFLGLKEEDFKEKFFDNFDALASALCYINSYFRVSYDS